MLRCFCHDYLFVVGFTLMEEREQSSALGSLFFHDTSHEPWSFHVWIYMRKKNIETKDYIVMIHDSHVCSFVTRAVEQLRLPFINAEVAKAFGLLPQLAAVPLGLCLSDDIVEDLLGAHFSGTFLKVTCAAWIWGNLQLRARRYEESMCSNCFLRSSRRLEIWSWFQGVVGITQFFVAVAYSLLTIIVLRKIGK